MDKEALYKAWKEEEAKAQIKGWDFSHIEDRYEEERELPWDFRQVIKNYLRDEMKLLDMETGGGEFLLSLGHPYSMTTAIEAYPPNVELCQHVLTPLGIDFHAADGGEPLAFPDESFDIITNRHGDYDISEIYRTLKPAGFFITQQVGAENDRDLVNLLQPDLTELPFPEQYLSIQEKAFRK